MKTIQAVWMAVTATAAYLSGQISEAECRHRINAARVLTGRPPMAGDK